MLKAVSEIVKRSRDMRPADVAAVQYCTIIIKSQATTRTDRLQEHCRYCNYVTLLVAYIPASVTLMHLTKCFGPAVICADWLVVGTFVELISQKALDRVRQRADLSQ